MEEVVFPKKLRFLFQPHRYKVAYGGRAACKTWSFARALLIEGRNKPIRVLCAREIQNSIKESVHQTLVTQIKALSLQSFYAVRETSIRGSNGTEFFFEGLRHNIHAIRSIEGIDRVWIEEAAPVSKNSWDVLIPTIRKPGSEIWVTFNPELDSDETYKRFVITPSDSAHIEKITFRDNPWLSDESRKEMIDLRERDYDAYLHVWEGHCKQTLDGAIYAKELRAATEAGRITKVPYSPTKGVQTFWDLGWSDMTSIWFAQAVGFDFRIIDFWQDRFRKPSEIVHMLQGKPYVYEADWLPHDAQNETLPAEGRSVEAILRAAGRNVRVAPKIGVEDGIKAAREIFPLCWFDEERCADGLNALRRYQYKVDPETGNYSKHPLHNEHSHCADALRTLAVSLKHGEKQGKLKLKEPLILGSGARHGWMR